MYYCGFCNFCTVTKDSFIRHSKIHVISRYYVCPLGKCQFRTLSHDHLIVHQEEHKKGYPYGCIYAGCQFRTTRRVTMITHIKICGHRLDIKI